MFDLLLNILERVNSKHILGWPTHRKELERCAMVCFDQRPDWKEKQTLGSD